MRSWFEPAPIFPPLERATVPAKMTPSQETHMTRKAFSLDLTDARRIIAAGERKAMEMGIPYNVLLGSDDLGGDLAQAYGYVNRSLPDAELDGFVDALARRIASFDKWAIAKIASDFTWSGSPLTLA
jgi:hypothetical protein